MTKMLQFFLLFLTLITYFIVNSCYHVYREEGRTWLPQLKRVWVSLLHGAAKTTMEDKGIKGSTVLSLLICLSRLLGWYQVRLLSVTALL